MGFALKLDLPISATVCDSCSATDKMQQISEGNLNLICRVPVSGGNNNVPNSDFSVKIDVRKIKWERAGKGAYTATAQLFVICPKCDKEHMVERCFEAPRIYLEQSRNCEICGGKLSFQEEEMDIEDRGGRPFVTISGRLICEKCKNETPYFADGSASDENKDANKETYVIACGKGQKLFIKMK